MGLSKPHPKVVGLAVVGLILSSVIPISTLAPVIAQGSAGSTVVSTDLTNGNDYSSPFSEPTPLTLGPTSSGSITLNPENPGQKIDGFGATLTGSAAADLMSLPSGTLEQVMNKLFGPTGADISLIRVPMGASDFSAIGDYTYDDPPSSDSATQKAAYSDLALTNFSIAPDMNNVIPILKMAEAINPSLQIIATPWTAPPWMKTNGGKSSLYVNTNSLEYTPAIYTNKGGTLKATKAIYEAYSKYFVDFIKDYAAQGVDVNYVTPQNEPENTNATNTPGMLLSPQAEGTFVSYLSSALSAASLSTKILVWDHNWADTGKNAPYPTKQTVPYPVTVLEKDPKVAGVAWHCYAGSPTAEAQISSNYLQLITECSGSGPDGPPHFAANLAWDSKNLVVGGITNGASGAQFFNLALNQNCGPQTAGGTTCVDPSPAGDGCEDCRGIVTISGSDSVHYNVEYYVLTEAAHALGSGMQYVPVTSTSASLKVVAAANADSGSTGLFVSNPTSSSVRFSADDGGEGFSYKIPGSSVVSFKWVNPTTESPWTAVEAPVPAGGVVGSAKWGVPSCSSGMCATNGAYTDTSGNTDYGAIWNYSGGSWSVVEAPMPAGGVAGSAELYDPSCSSGTCAAIGAYTDTSGNTDDGAIWTYSGSSWSVVEAPVPAGGVAGSGGNWNVSCSSGTCAATGFYTDMSGATDGAIWAYSGGSWSVVEARVPAGGVVGSADLSGGDISCSSGTCAATGSYTDTSGNTHGAIWTYSGGSWSVVEAPVPAGGVVGGAEFDYNVSCSSGTCAATGYYIDTSGNTDGAIWTYSGGPWSVVEAPVPAGGVAGSAEFVGFGAVSCSSGTCAVTGSYNDYTDGAIWTYSGSSWSVVEAPVPAAGVVGSAGFVDFDLSCSSGTCVATAQYLDTSRHSHGAIWTYSGSSWSVVEAALPAGGAAGSAELYDPSCSSGTCAATGSYTDTSGTIDGAIWTGSS